MCSLLLQLADVDWGTEDEKQQHALSDFLLISRRRGSLLLNLKLLPDFAGPFLVTACFDKAYEIEPDSLLAC